MQEPKPKIHVDMIGAFFDPLSRVFIECGPDDQKAMMEASYKLLEYMETVITKESSILYLDGRPTIERNNAYTRRLTRQLTRQQRLEEELAKLETQRNGTHLAKLDYKARKLFRFTEDMKRAFFQAATESAWTIITAHGEAEVEIGKRGGTVLSEDSDMFFYPNSQVVNWPSKHRFYVYRKYSILERLQISNNAFTVLGIISANDYDYNCYFKLGTLVSNEFSFYQIVKRIDSSNPGMSVKGILDAFIAEMNLKTSEAISSDYYSKSYRVFALQEQHLLPYSYDIRLGYLNTASYYLKQLK
ncbi:hypothetical protein V8B55DRAFT_1560177 [Mucor lusitanicus]|uniref:Uncharacterized protein n=2 Tax=Mucor circinelloides f. lusitanicus TaxID=29924 RepID=A0A168P8B3_MUCCL|nr:hypothetical protein FB192DRAFT_1470983 [Mucor lusitanicus]OAD07324.1 hypothetical protein MUCCIDRAFT_77702 [Mucor lusitanicus CBS 277.49]